MAESDKRHREAMARMDRMDARHERDHRKAMDRIDRAEERMDRQDKKLVTLQKLVEFGWKAIQRQAAESRRTRADTTALRAEMRAFLKAWGNGRGGSNGRH